MATITPTWVQNNDTTMAATWASFTQADTGTALLAPFYPDKAVQIFGTFGAALSVRIEGSNDGSTFAVLHDAQGNDLDLTAAGIKMILENPLYIRPRATAGAASSVTIIIAGVANR